MDDSLLTVRDVARRVGRSEETVRRWIWSGKLKARKLGNQLFVDPEDLAAMEGHGRVLKEVAAPYRRRGMAMDERDVEDVYAAGVRAEYDIDRMDALMARARDFRERIFRRTGYIDVEEAVRESREEH